MDVSVIIRFRDEADYLEPTLRAVRGQAFSGNFEILGVDHESTDGSSEIAKRFADRVIPLDTYRPGRALNLAIELAAGAHIAVLSAHTIPASRDWLTTLMAHKEQPRLAGVYGAQLYNINARFLDKRDLDIFSTLEPRVETSDTDFWNANAMFARAVWEEARFDETVFELEDHYWTKLHTPRGYHVQFEPQALVYHYTHLTRNDREFLPPSPLSKQERIDVAIAALNDPAADWPAVMVAGLELSSMTDQPGIDRAVPAIGHHLATHPDFDVRWRMAGALGKIPTPNSVRFLADALNDPSYYPRDEAAWALARLRALAVPEVEARCDDLPDAARPFAALALGLSGVAEAEQRAVGLLRTDLASDDDQRRRDAAYFAGELGHLPASRPLVPLIARLLSGSNELVRVGCWALGCFAADRLLNIDWRHLTRLAAEHEHPLVRYEAVVALGKRALHRADPETLEVVRAAIADPVGRVRYGSVQSLRLLAEAGGRVPNPPRLVEDDDFGVRFEGELLARARGSAWTT
jgi:HEAT repeat protein